MKNWKTIRLGEVLKPSKKIIELEPEQTYKQITIRMNHKGVILRGLIQGSQVGSKQYVANENQFIVSKIDARNGAYGIVPKELQDAIVTGDFLLFDTEKKIDVDFLNYFSNTNYFNFECKKASEGTTNRVRLKVDKFLSIEIPLPPLAEQQRIVARLSALKNKIDEVKILRGEQEKLKHSIRYSLIVDAEKKYDKVRIGEICKLQKGSFPIMQTQSGQFPFVVTGEERKNAIDFDFDGEAVCIPLVSSTGHGNAALHRVHYENGKFALSNILCGLTSKNSNLLFTKFLYEVCMAMKDVYFVPLMQGTSNVSLSMDKIASVKIPLPPLTEQQRIIDILSKLNITKQYQTEQMTLLNGIFPSLLNKAFRGEL